MELERRIRDIAGDLRVSIRMGYPWWLRPWLLRDVVAITLGRHVYLSARVASMSPSALLRLLRHELAHVAQVNRLGLVRFLWLYAREFVRHLGKCRSISDAYSAISFEVEARAAERSEEGTGL